MASSIFFIGFSFLLLLTATQAIDIVKELKAYPDLSMFSQYLQQTNVANELTNRKTITVLAVDNANIAPLAGKPQDELKKVMMSHVILDYYDKNKIKEVADNTSVTTLYQTSGLADGRQGFLRITKKKDYIAFEDSAFVKEVSATPYTLSILQVNSPIIFHGGNGSTAAAPISSSNSSAAAPKSSSTNSTAAAPKSSSNSTAAAAPKGSKSTSDSPAPTPANSKAHASDAPADSPSDAAADAPAAAKSGATAVGGVAFAAMFMMILSSSAWILM